MILKIILSIITLYNTIYLISYALWEKKQKNLKGFGGVCILVLVVIGVLWAYFVA